MIETTIDGNAVTVENISGGVLVTIKSPFNQNNTIRKFIKEELLSDALKKMLAAQPAAEPTPEVEDSIFE